MYDFPLRTVNGQRAASLFTFALAADFIFSFSLLLFFLPSVCTYFTGSVYT